MYDLSIIRKEHEDSVLMVLRLTYIHITTVYASFILTCMSLHLEREAKGAPPD